MLAVLPVFAAFSCRISRNAEIRTDNSSTERYEGIFRRADSSFAALQLMRKEVNERLSDLKVENTVTYYSPPDSAGRQHPVCVSTTRADRRERESERSDTELYAMLERMTNRLDSLSRTASASSRSHQKIMEVTWWDLHKWQVLGGAGFTLLIVCGILVYRLKKK